MSPAFLNMMKTTRLFYRLFFVIVAVVGAGRAFGQEFPLNSNSTVNTCSGALTDSGAGPSDYGLNEDYTMTICPDVPGNVVTLNWQFTDLDQSGPQASWDRIQIFNGENTSAPMMADVTGADPDLNSLTAYLPTNPSGCLTVRFISNGVGTGNFAANISCEIPCESPTAAGTMNSATPAMICVGEELSFDGSGSTESINGFPLVTYTWNFDDGQTAEGVTATHSWDESGAYNVQLEVADSNGCVNTNVIDLLVLVSTEPDFTGTVLEDVTSCIGASVVLDASGTVATTWYDTPSLGSSTQFNIYDSTGVPYSDEILVTQFEPGQTLEDCSDLMSVCLRMHHTFMGDLLITLTCPTGQTQTLHQQGGGGTDLGLTGNLECLEYCFTPVATNGTWVDNTGDPFLPAGTYEPLEACNDLQGCTLNGTWTITYVDLWAADEGESCGWDLEFNPQIIPDIFEFTPTLGINSPDSSGWTGTSVVPDPSDPTIAQVTLTDPGTYDYTFFVTDNFGCTYDTTIIVTVPEQIVVDAGDPIVLCSDPLPMAGVILANGPPATCVWELVLYEAAGDTWSGGANLAVTYDGVTTNYTVPFGPEELSIPLNVETGESIELFYTAGTSWNNENSFTLFDDIGGAVYASMDGPPTGLSYSGVVVCGGGTTPVVFEWTPTTGLDDPTDPETNVYVTEPTLFYLSTYPTGHPECAVMDSVWVSPDPSIDAGEPATMIICASDPAFQMTDSLGGTPDDDGVWTSSTGVVVSNTFEPIAGASDVYTYTVTSAAGCVATSTLDITVIPADDPACCGVVDAGIDAFSCGLTIELSATRGNTGVGNWQGPAGAVFADPFNTVTAVTVQPGMGGTHTFYWVENDGAFCDLIDSVRITFTDAYVFTPTVTDALCYGYSDGSIFMDVVGGNAAAGLDFSWSNGVDGIMEDTINGLSAGTYSLLVTDDNGCTGSTEVLVGQPIRLEIDSLAMLPVTCSGDCDGTVLVFDAEAVEYSYDDGTTWTLDATRPASCEGVWVVRIKDQIGCIGIGQVELMGPPPVVAAFDWGPNPANVDAPTITFANLSTGSDHYFWNVADLFSTTDLNTVFTFDNKEPDMYEVCLTAYNYNECSDTICQTVVIDDVLFTYIPNAFTPDGDDVNDVWWPSANIPVRTNYELLVFDRWGQVVFNTTDPYTPWEGSYQNGGEVLKSDVYAYRLLYGIGDTEARKEVVGYVTLMK